jgi:hypothetical protein
VSVLVGDRLCTGCTYNLTGQPVVREPHYDMLIVRCPECGVVASVQEYPLLGRWAGRWAALIAAGWFVALLVFLFITTAVLAGMSDSVAQRASEPFALRIGALQQQHFTSQQPAANTPAYYLAQQQVHAWMSLDPGWVSVQDFEAVLAGSGGVWRNVKWGALRGWMAIVLFAFPAGCFWAVFLAHLRRRVLLVAGLVPVALGAAFASVSMWDWMNVGWMPALLVARSEVGAPFEYGSLAFAYLPLAAGLVLGRPIVRGLVRALLPPRMRGALAVLWTVEGLLPPPGRISCRSTRGPRQNTPVEGR